MPVPTKVLIVPPGLTLRTRLLAKSEMKTLPAPSATTAPVEDSSASSAGPPSPEKPPVPVPAKVLIVPAPFTLRVLWFPESAM